MLRKILLNPFACCLLLLMLTALACTLSTDPPPTPTPIPPTFTPPPVTPTVAVAVSSPTTLAPTLPSVTPQVATLTPSVTPLPTSTPYTLNPLVYDLYQPVEVNPQMPTNITETWVIYRNVNDRGDEVVDARTPQSDTGTETLYLARPSSGERIRVASIPATAEGNIFWSPNGRYIAYFLKEGVGVASNAVGLYVLDLQAGIAIRYFQMPSLQPRGIAGHRPYWSPDSSKLMMVLPTAYDTDIFTINVDGSNFVNLTNSPAYEFWASWSPDGSKIAYVSDRTTCPTWQPNVAGTCDKPNATPPQGGNLYVLDVATGQTQQINNTYVSGAPEWVNERFIAVTSGSLDPLATKTELWLYDIPAGTAWQVSPEGNALFTAATWRSDAQAVAYQQAQESTALVITNDDGEVLQSLADYNFPRFGVSMAWSPDNKYLAIAGRNGQCPYGLIVLNEELRLVNAPSTTLSACDPIYAPNGRYMAFMGIRSSPGSDARQDIYVAGVSGLGATNITSALSGQVSLVGWLSPQ